MFHPAQMEQVTETVYLVVIAEIHDLSQGSIMINDALDQVIIAGTTKLFYIILIIPCLVRVVKVTKIPCMSLD